MKFTIQSKNPFLDKDNIRICINCSICLALKQRIMITLGITKKKTPKKTLSLKVEPNLTFLGNVKQIRHTYFLIFPESLP